MEKTVKSWEWIIVGAGFTGATLAERIATQLGKKVLLVDRRSHIGGNAFDFHNADACLIHKYGPHIFHTNSDKVWQYLSKFTLWRSYSHRVLASVDGQLVPVPFSLASLRMLLPTESARRTEASLVDRFGFGTKVPIMELLNDMDPEIKTFARFVYQKVFENYTTKQWGLSPTELDSSVTGRVPVLIGVDDRYFQDKYQAIPEAGYTKMFERMTSHENISILLNTDYSDIRQDLYNLPTIYTGALDELYDYKFGALPYRSLTFVNTLDGRNGRLPAGTINYPNEYEYTRVTDMSRLTDQSRGPVVTVAEFPRAHEPGQTDAYYPIPQQVNRDLHDTYLKHAQKIDPHFCFAGRLADYKYYNMDQAVARALHLFSSVVIPQVAKG